MGFVLETNRFFSELHYCVILKEMEKSRVKKVKKEEVDNNSDWSWLMDKGISGPFICISLFSILVRVSVSMHPYSGAGDSPKYGDFEAQRHWMEITTNLPVNEWYHNSTSNDLAYWGLDYPPLTAYQSYVHGIFLRFFHPDSVSLYTSRGHESYTGSVVVFHLLHNLNLPIFQLYILGVVWFVECFWKD